MTSDSITEEKLERPLCKCHDEPMNKNGFNPLSQRQQWVCRIASKAKAKRYDATERGRQNKVDRDRTYEASLKGMIRKNKYRLKRAESTINLFDIDWKNLDIGDLINA